jgi:hypothetical protein
MLFAATHPEIVDKMIIADIGPKFYPQHHQSILAGLNAEFLHKPSRSAVEAILSEYISDFGTRQFLMKVCIGRAGTTAFRFNLSVLIKNG